MTVGKGTGGLVYGGSDAQIRTSLSAEETPGTAKMHCLFFLYSGLFIMLNNDSNQEKKDSNSSIL